MTAFRRRNIAVILAAPLAFGVWSLLLGQDTNWDLRNYHWYDPFALLNGRADLDAAPAGLQTYYSPLIDLAWYGLGRSLPGPWVGFVIGAVQSANLVLLYLLGLRLLPVERPLERQLAALLVAVTGVGGAASVTELGTTFNDNIVSIGVPGSLLLVARWWPTLLRGARRDAVRRALVAGLPIGAAFAGKLPMGAFAVALAAAFLVAPCRVARRITLAVAFAAGAAAATAILLGPWLVHCWQLTGNPIFPFLNGLFRSPLAAPGSYWMDGLQPRGLADALTFPLRFVGIGPRVMELPFRDFRIAAAYVVVPALLVLGAGLRAGRPALPPVPTLDGYVFVAMLLGYACWVAAFAYYRYLVPLEMLAPLLIALAVLRVPAPRLVQRAAVALAMVLLLVTSHAADYGRAPWGDRFVAVKVPSLARPEASVVLLLGQPTAFVIPSFPPPVRFLQLVPNFAPSDDPTVPWHRLMQARIDAHGGEFHAILIGQEAPSAQAVLAGYGLALVEDGCRPLDTNLTIWPQEALRFCPVVRRGAPAGGAGSAPQ